MKVIQFVVEVGLNLMENVYKERFSFILAMSPVFLQLQRKQFTNKILN